MAVAEHPAVAFLQRAHEQAELAAQGCCTQAQFDAMMVYGPTGLRIRVTAERKLLAEHSSDGWDRCERCQDEEPLADRGTALPWPCGVWLGLAEAWGWTMDMQEQEQAEDVPATYAAARAAAARSLWESAELARQQTGAGWSLYGALCDLQAGILERPSPFASMGIKPYDLVLPSPPEPWDGPRSAAGCYAASWGWVHMKPGCRCPR